MGIQKHFYKYVHLGVVFLTLWYWFFTNSVSDEEKAFELRSELIG